jgi:hypothetical protein
MSKKFIAYCAMRNDLNLVLEYIETLREIGDNRVIKSSLTYALIALYGKCYTDASKNSYPKLEPSSLFSENEELLETHEFLMDLRHQFVAHRGKTDSEIGISFMAIPKDKKSDPQVRFKQLKLGAFGLEKLNNIEILVLFIIEQLEIKIQKSGQKVYDGFFNLFDAKQMSFMIMNNMEEPDNTKEEKI